MSLMMRTPSLVLVQIIIFPCLPFLLDLTTSLRIINSWSHDYSLHSIILFSSIYPHYYPLLWLEAICFRLCAALKWLIILSVSLL